MDVGAGVLAQPAQVGTGPVIVLATTDGLLNHRVEGLHADLELQRFRWKTRQYLAQLLGQIIGNHLEVEV